MRSTVYMGGQKFYCDPEQLSRYLKGQASYEHYFLISTHVALVQPGWLYFGFFLQWVFQFVPKKKKRLTDMRMNTHASAI